MRPTIKDIAKLAGVSTSTVSRSLNDSSLISEKTKSRILKIAKELDFEFNASAQSLSKKRTDTIGVVYPEDVDIFGVGGFLMEILTEIRNSLEKESFYSIMTCPVNNYTRKSNIRKLTFSGNIDGLIIIHWDLAREDLEIIKSRKIPHVFLHHIPDIHYMNKSSVITTDHYHGGKIAAKHLLKLGHTEILCFTSSDNDVEFGPRTDGFSDTLKRCNIILVSQRIIKGPHTFDFAYRYVKNNLLSIKRQSITAIFAQSDVMAFGIIKALQENNIRVPDDISVIGYDGSELGVMIYPGLTSIRQPVKAMVSESCSIVINNIDVHDDDIKPVRRKLIPTLIKRDSCRYLKS